MRAGRLVALLMLLQDRGQVTAAELARQLEVSPRTILRDIEALSGAGVPVFATRGARGGFQLLGAYERSLPLPAGVPARRATSARRARARLSLPGRRLVALIGRPAGVQVRTRAKGAGTGTWVEATWPIDTLDAAVLDVLSLGAEVEIVGPADLRAAVAETARRIADRHAPEPVSR